MGPMADFGAARMQAPAPAFTRPVALPSPGQAYRPAEQAPPQSSGFSNPVSAVRRRIAWSLSMRQSVSVGPLGYVTVVLLALVLVMGILLIMALLPVGTYLLQHANLRDAWNQLGGGQQELVKKMAIVVGLLGTITLLFFSVFIGLSTHNATGLGADQPLLAPYRAGTCWTRLIWTQARIAVGLIVPALLLWENYAIAGLIAGIVAVEIAHRHIDDAGGWLERPTRHLADLYAKFGLDNSVSSPAGSAWSACFRIANWMAILVAAIPAFGYVLYVASRFAGRDDIIGWSSAGLGIGQIAAALLVGSFIGWSIASIALLVPLTFGFVQRQRTRKTLVRVGRARSWVARPGDARQGQQQRSGPEPTRYGGFEDEDRIVERRPGYGLGGEPFPDSGASGPGFDDPGSGGFGGPGFAGPGPAGPGPGFGGPGFGGPGQGSSGGGRLLGNPRPGSLPPSGPGPLPGPGFGGPTQGGPGQGGWG